jgi:type III secretion system YscQ/HrcQ family protein
VPTIALDLTGVRRVTADRPLPRREQRVAFGLRGPRNAEAVLFLGGKLADALVACSLRATSLGIRTHFSETEIGLLGALVASLLGGARDGAWSIELRDRELVVGPWLVYELVLSLPHLRGLAWVVCPEGMLLSGVDSFRPRADHGLERRKGTWLTDLTLPVGISAGVLELQLAQLRGLDAGDLLIFADCPRSVNDCLLWANIGGGAFPLKRMESAIQLAVDGLFKKRACGMEPIESRGERLEDSLAVELVVELARVQMQVAAVLGLRPGDVLNLERPLGAAVDLRLGGRLIATGELVNVDGESGIRLIEVYE